MSSRKRRRSKAAQEEERKVHLPLMRSSQKVRRSAVHGRRQQCADMIMCRGSQG
jgi:hypothetical protein